jgi:2-isopropylmalate synthase
MQRLTELGIRCDPRDPRVGDLIDLLKAREAAGYAYEGAAASFELMVRRLLQIGAPREYFRLVSYKVVDERRASPGGDVQTVSEATVEIEIDGIAATVTSFGNGPVDALDTALRRALEPLYPALRGVLLTDYKVRILTPEDGTKALTRVLIESKDPDGEDWCTVGVATNVIDASYRALEDSLVFRLMRGEAA